MMFAVEQDVTPATSKCLQMQSLSLHVANIHVPNDYIEVLNDSSTYRLRSFVPGSARGTFYPSCIIYRNSGTNASIRLIADQSVQPLIKSYIHYSVKYCVHCQQAKVDITRPLPQCVGNDYLLICVDHFTCWYEVFPMSDITGYITGENFILDLVYHFFQWLLSALLTEDVNLSPTYFDN